MYTLHRKEADRIAERVLAKQPAKLTIAVRESELAEALSETSRSTRPNAETACWSREQIAATLDPRTRDLGVLGTKPRRTGERVEA